MLVRVSLSQNIFESLTYKYLGDPGALPLGSRVLVPIVNRLTTGWVMEKDSSYKGRVKPVLGVIDAEYVPPATFLDFARAVSDLYFTSAGMVLDASVSPKRKSITNACFQWHGETRKLKETPVKELLEIAKQEPPFFFFKSREKKSLFQPDRDAQHENNHLQADTNTVANELPKDWLVVDYNRIDHFSQRIRETLDSGLSVLIAVPDNLSAGYISRHPAFPGANVYNSDITLKDREKVWREFAGEGKAGIVTGGLSAVTLPMANLGMVIIERAGSALYHRIAFSRFNTHVLAHLRARCQGAALVEAGPGHTVSAYHRRAQIVVSDKRPFQIPVNVHPIPPGIKGIPGAFIELVHALFDGKKKLLVVVNRRECVEYPFCPACKKLCSCPKCGGFLEIIRDFDVSCPRCNWQKENYSICPSCSGPHTIVENLSVSSVTKVLQNKVIENGVIALSAEDLKASKIESMLEKVKKYSIVTGTLAVVNPYFAGMFDHVIYFRPEAMVNLDAHDGAERVYSMIAELKEMVKQDSSVEIFSTFHFHYCLKLVNDEDAFFQREIKYREWFRLPPFYYVYHLEFRAKDLRTLAKRMRQVYSDCKETLGIKRVYLSNRSPVRGLVKGEMEAHALPEDIRQSGLLNDRNINIDLDNC